MSTSQCGHTVHVLHAYGQVPSCGIDQMHHGGTRQLQSNPLGDDTKMLLVMERKVTLRLPTATSSARPPSPLSRTPEDLPALKVEKNDSHNNPSFAQSQHQQKQRVGDIPASSIEASPIRLPPHVRRPNCTEVGITLETPRETYSIRGDCTTAMDRDQAALNKNR